MKNTVAKKYSGIRVKIFKMRIRQNCRANTHQTELTDDLVEMNVSEPVPDDEDVESVIENLFLI